MADPTTDTPVLDLLASMTADSVEASSLDPEALMLVRIAALVAVDAPPASYLLNLGAAREMGIDPEPDSRRPRRGRADRRHCTRRVRHGRDRRGARGRDRGRRARGPGRPGRPVTEPCRRASRPRVGGSPGRSRQPRRQTVRSNHIMTRRFGAALVVAVVVLVSALGCASDDDDSGTTEAATGATGNTDTGTRTLGEGIENLQDAQAQLCPELANLSADLTEISTSGTEAGQDALARHRIHRDSSRRQRNSVDRGRGRRCCLRRRRPRIQPGVAGRLRRRGRPGTRRRGGRRRRAADGCPAVSVTDRPDAPNRRRHRCTGFGPSCSWSSG